jgi:signal transduction histidine kinase
VLEEALATGTVRSTEAELSLPTGVRSLQITCVPLLDAQGEVYEIMGVTHDLTDRKRYETEILLFNAELEERVRERTAQVVAANKELETFAYSVSHDLKAPLRGIDGYSRLLMEDCAAALSEDCRQFVGNIRDGTEQMRRLIDDLLAYSRMERRALQDYPMAVVAVVQSVLAERAEEIRARGVEVRVDLPEATVRADPDGLLFVLRNLVDNALKFTREARPPIIEIGGRHEGEGEQARQILWVKDNGIGFDMKFHDRIFEIFQRLQRAEAYPGTGIGLAIVNKAMQRMKGRVWSESEPGRGATFYLELPA